VHPSRTSHEAVVTVLSAMCTFLVGMVLVFVPWTSLWEVSHFLMPHPLLRAAALSTITRGAVTGLGLVNVLLAADEIRTLIRRSHRGA
jgi:hypothetical protein